MVNGRFGELPMRINSLRGEIAKINETLTAKILLREQALREGKRDVAEHCMEEISKLLKKKAKANKRLGKLISRRFQKARATVRHFKRHVGARRVPR